MSLTIRPRKPADLPALCEVLAAQQPTSRYPMRWPLPFPVVDFIARSDELGAWTALADGVIVGHVSVQRVDEAGDLRDLSRLWREGQAGDDQRRLAAIAALFVSVDTRGSGTGRALLDVATSAIADLGLVPVLEVVRGHSAAIELYRKQGWREVGELWPAWMPPKAPDGPVVAMVLTPTAAEDARSAPR